MICFFLLFLYWKWDVIPYVCGVCLCICIQIVINLYINFIINFVSWFSIFMILTLNFSFYLFEEPQKTNSKYFKNLLFTNPYYMTELLAALSFQTMLLIVLPFSWMCTFTVANFTSRLPHRKFSPFIFST